LPLIRNQTVGKENAYASFWVVASRNASFAVSTHYCGTARAGDEQVGIPGCAKW
jgi:hypothetical protein